MFLTLIIMIIFLILIKLIIIWNANYCILSACKRFKPIVCLKSNVKDLFIIPSKTVFGHNFDLLGAAPETIFAFFRNCTKIAKNKSYGLYYLFAPVYNITNPEDAEQVFQSQVLITKGVVYEIVREFLGLGLLISTDNDWQFRRKILTPAFHFNILQTFVEIFKEESLQFTKTACNNENEIITLNKVIPHFTLSNVCETALGIKLNDAAGSHEYRKAVNDIDPIIVRRLCNPMLYYSIVFKLFGDYKNLKRLVNITHSFSSRIIEQRREEFRKNREDESTLDNKEEYGKKKRYAMLDTLLEAEAKGLIDHQGICDEVNTFMFEGYDTTSVCLIFSLLNLACYPDIQEKCYEEVKNSPDISELSVFDFSKFEYLECVIKEVLRLHPSVPFIQRQAMADITLNGSIIPKNTQINIHIYDILRDPKHFPDPEKFDPDRFLPHNTLNRHPFAFVPFSAGPRNCIGQKFAMLEIKILLVSIMKNFKLFPVTRLADITFESGLVLRSKYQIKVRFVSRKQD